MMNIWYSQFCRQNKLTSQLELISFVSVCLYLFDCAWSGSGRWLMFGPISIRMILLGTAIMCSIPIMLKNIKKIFANVYTICLLLFLLLLTINMVRGLLATNRIEILLSDLKGFSYYAMFPTLLVILNSRQRIKTAMQSILAGCTFLALFSMIIFVDYAAFHMQFTIDLPQLYDCRIFAFNPMGASLLRLFSFSGIFLTAGCVIAFYLFLTEQKYKWIYSICTGLCLFALLVTFTRSFYLQLLVCILSVMVVLPFLRKSIRTAISFVVASVMIFAIILVPVSMISGINYLGYAVEKTLLPLFNNSLFDSSAVINENETPGLVSTQESIQKSLEITVQSDTFRKDTLDELYMKISEHPIIGHGLGASVDIRESGATEYFYLDFTYKAGLVGLSIYLLPLFILIGMTISRVCRRDSFNLIFMKYTMLICLLGFMACSYFNPFMNAALGVTMFSLTMATDSLQEATDSKESLA